MAWAGVWTVSCNCGTSGGSPGVADALREMQRAWIVFRDKACTYEASLWQGGTGRGPAAINCLMQQTARQALSLDVWEG